MAVRLAAIINSLAAWVIGFRNMFNGTTGDKDITINRFGDPIFDGATVNLKNQWFDALTARLGYAWSPTWLMYGQGGAVWSKVKADDHQSSVVLVVLVSVIKVALPVTLAAPPRPEQAGRLVVALNGGSRRSGRRFWKVITTTSATMIGPYSRTTSVLVAVTSAVASTPKRPQPPSWSA